MPGPNVLLVCVDHWPGPLLAAAGHPVVLTPTLDELCDVGVRFSEAYSATPTCVPARRALMTGTTARTHGDRVFSERLPMDGRLVTMPQAFRDAGYQAYAVGKLHVYPQRSRIGFDEVILNEEGRHHLGMLRDDYEAFLVERGFAGQELTHGMSNNEYAVRPWHLPEDCHQTHWTTRETCRAIRRRDPTRPAFWYCSYAAPHPPLTPLRDYLDMYLRTGVDEPFVGEWARDAEALPYALAAQRSRVRAPQRPREIELARAAFYAQCTYIDHQMRLLIGTLREEGLLGNTVIAFVSDHGDMLGNHLLWAKPPMHEYSAKIPMILVGADGDARVGRGVRDDRLAELRDVMPTLLELCGIPIPATVEGLSLVSGERRPSLYGEHWEGDRAMRMVRKGPHKLIYYPVENRFQLFDLDSDPRELHDLSQDPSRRSILQELSGVLSGELYGADTAWLSGGRLVGLPAKKADPPAADRGLHGQRGWR